MGTTSGRARAGAHWLGLREPADAESRSVDLVEQIRTWLPTDGEAVVHDLGSGTGAMGRWLGPRLGGRQRWILHDRDAELLVRAAANPPVGADGAPITVQTRRRDITRLDPAELAGAALVTASALLDMFTGEELGRFVATCAGATCPVLITLTVVGRVELTPADPLDERVAEAFNVHQRRRTEAGPLLGPDALPAAADEFARWGLDIVVRPSPWRLGPARAELAQAWLAGWLAAAFEQRPELADQARDYAERRAAEAAAGRLGVIVHHQDLLAAPAGGDLPGGLARSGEPNPASPRFDSDVAGQQVSSAQGGH